jgi:hypothetical protein
MTARYRSKNYRAAQRRAYERELTRDLDPLVECSPEDEYQGWLLAVWLVGGDGRGRALDLYMEHDLQELLELRRRG